MTEPESMRVRVRANAPIADVWHALTDPDEMRVWLAEHAEVDLPHRYVFWGRNTPEGAHPHQRLLAVEEHMLRFSWQLEGIDTTTEIRLDEDGPDSTTLSLVQTGIPPWEELLAETTARSLLHTFWALALANLVDHVEGREITGKCDLTSPEMRIRLDIGGPRQAVYDSIADPERFGTWFGAKVDADGHVGGRWAMGGFDLDPSPAKIVELDPGHRMAIEWPDGMTSSWELEDSDGKTRLTFVQSGFDEGHPPYGSWMGWLSGFAELRRYHELGDWHRIWLDVQVDGQPEGIIVLD